MTENKPIMINGVDVSKCEYWANSELGYCLIGLWANDGTHICECEPNCYFKQLTRKTQECKELQYQLKCVTGREKEHRKNSDFWEKHCKKLQEQLDQLKAELEAERNWHKTADEISKANSEYTSKLKQALQEIQEIAEYEFKELMNAEDYHNMTEILQQILQIIDEVEG